MWLVDSLDLYRDSKEVIGRIVQYLVVDRRRCLSIVLQQSKGGWGLSKIMRQSISVATTLWGNALIYLGSW